LTVTAHRVINSFTREVPLIFMKGGGTVDKPLTKIPTPKDWDNNDGFSGLKNEITQFLNQQVPGSEQSIEARFAGPNHVKAKNVALACLHESKAFIEELNDFISAFYREMESHSGGQGAEAWTLTCKLVKGIFFELNLVRIIAARASDVEADDKGRRIGLILWGTLRAHKLMREFRKSRFRRHPTVAPTLTLHTFTTRVSAEMMAQLQAEVAALTKLVKDNKTNADKALDLVVQKRK
jgi:hypothetical protein